MKAVACTAGIMVTIDRDGHEYIVMEDERRDDRAYFDSDSCMYDLFEELIGNSDLDWIAPEDIGALTEAPILGRRDEDGEVTEAFGFMDYQIESVQARLLETGCAIFIKG